MKKFKFKSYCSMSISKFKHFTSLGVFARTRQIFSFDNIIGGIKQQNENAKLLIEVREKEEKLEHLVLQTVSNTAE